MTKKTLNISPNTLSRISYLQYVGGYNTETEVVNDVLRHGIQILESENGIVREAGVKA